MHFQTMIWHLVQQNMTLCTYYMPLIQSYINSCLEKLPQPHNPLHAQLTLRCTVALATLTSLYALPAYDLALFT